MANNNQIEVPEARQALERLKFEVANEVGVDPKGYGGDVPARKWGQLGGHMVRELIKKGEQHI